MKVATVYMKDKADPITFESEQISCEHINGCVRIFTHHGVYIFPSENVVYIHIRDKA